MLQGSLENFALDEVLGLLSSTNKTGQLEISGDRGTGSLMFNEGRLVDGTASHTANGTEVEDVMFELLRYGDGTFTFTNREVGEGDSPQIVAKVLAAAENRLADWRQIEAVVPSLDHHVAPSADLPADEVSINRAEWAVLTVVASGCPASQVCQALELGEVEGSRQIKLLAERQLVSVSEPTTGIASMARASESLSPTATESTPAFEMPTGPAGEPDPIAAAPGMPAATELGDAALMGALTDDSLSAGLLSIEAMSEGAAATAEPEPTTAPAETEATTAESATDRPPMPPAPTAAELSEDDSAGTPDTPPSPAEISDFGASVDDLSALVDDSETAKSGGLLARYRKNDD
ncbi:MAG: DUF4388 domain-containing protein [Actinomycetota bacterium]